MVITIGRSPSVVFSEGKVAGMKPNGDEITIERSPHGCFFEYNEKKMGTRHSGNVTAYRTLSYANS